MNRRRDMVANLRTKVNQMASTLNMSNFANRDSLLGPEIKPADAMHRTEGLDNHGIVGLQWQIMKGKLLPLVADALIVMLVSFLRYWFLTSYMLLKQSKMRALKSWRRQ